MNISSSLLLIIGLSVAGLSGAIFIAALAITMRNRRTIRRNASISAKE